MHKGCFKCRRFYVRYDRFDCPNSFPNGTTYKTLIPEAAEAAKAKYTTRLKSATIATTSTVDSMGQTVEAIQTTSPAAATSGVLGDDTKSDSNDEYEVISIPHMTWFAVIRGRQHASLSPKSMLIDSGLPTVLIRDDPSTNTHYNDVHWSNQSYSRPPGHADTNCIQLKRLQTTSSYEYLSPV